MTDLSAALAEGTHATGHGESASLSLHPLGQLVMPTGQLFACDPFLVSSEEGPFTRTVPPGRYPVLVNVARMQSGDERVAYAIVRVADPPPVRWELALLPAHDPSELGDDEFFGYGVDSGTGCFMDASAAERLAERAAEIGDNQDLEDQMVKTYVHTWAWVDYVLDADTGVNVIAFSSGWGDGMYPSYWGLDEAGAIVCLVTDFGVFWATPDD